jgi:hypothetical protein
MKKLDEIKAKLKKHAPELMVAGLTVAGSLGWVMAGVYATKLEKLESLWDRTMESTEGYETIDIPTETMDEVRDGATLKYRQKILAPNHIYTQITTAREWPEKAEEDFEAKK